MRDALGNVQSVVVLGGGSDIALATARALCGPRVQRVVLAARRPDELADRAATLAGTGATVETVAYDATVDGAATAVLTQAAAAGDIDVVLVAFGWLGPDFTLDGPITDVRHSIDVNFTAAAVAAVEAARFLRRQGHGTVVVLTSVAGMRVRRRNAVYGAAKAGIDGFVLALDHALEGTGVRAMVVRPGYVSTKMTEGRPVTPFATGPEVVADRTVHGLRRAQRVVWSPAAMRPVFAVMRLLPEKMWRRLSDR